MTIELAMSLGLFMIAVLGAAGTAWWRVESKIATVAAAAALVQRELDAHRLHVAETYVSKQGHREATDQIMTALDSLKASLDGTNQRIDRWFENSAKRARSST